MVQLNKYGNYKRVLKVPQLQERFRRHQMLHDFEVDELFKGVKHRPFNAQQYRYLQKGIRHQVIFDIETSDFNPLGNFIIGYVAIHRDIVTGKEVVHEDSIRKSDISLGVKLDSFNFDTRLLSTLMKIINRADQVVGHFSSKFDMPYVRSRLLLTNQGHLIPRYGDVRYGDSWRMMKNSIKAPRNTLVNLALYTNTKNEKTIVSMEHWKRCYFKDSPKWAKSKEYIMSHCRKDVRMTLTAVKKIEGFNNVMLANV